VFLPQFLAEQVLVRPACARTPPGPGPVFKLHVTRALGKKNCPGNPRFSDAFVSNRTAWSGGDAMTPEERKLVLEPANPDPDLEEHVKTYLMFTHLVKYCMFAAPFFFAFVFYWTV
jgi:hypothetical protein